GTLPPCRTQSTMARLSASTALTHLSLTVPMVTPLHSLRRSVLILAIFASSRSLPCVASPRSCHLSLGCFALGGALVVSSSAESVAHEPSHRRTSNPPPAPETCIPPVSAWRRTMTSTSSSNTSLSPD